MRTFEYKAVDDGMDEKRLNELGAQGWELNSTFVVTKPMPLSNPPLQMVQVFVFIREKEA